MSVLGRERNGAFWEAGPVKRTFELSAVSSVLFAVISFNRHKTDSTYIFLVEPICDEKPDSNWSADVHNFFARRRSNN